VVAQRTSYLAEDTWHSLQLKTEGDNIQIWANGSLYLQGTDDSLSGGDFAFFNSGSQSTYYDNVNLAWEPHQQVLNLVNGASVSNVASSDSHMTVHDNATVQVSSGSSLAACHQYRIDDSGNTVIDGEGSTLAVTDAGTSYSGRLYVGHTTGGRGTMTVSGGADVTAESGVHVSYHSSGYIGAGSTGADASQVDLDGDGLVDGSQLTITGAGSTVVTGDGTTSDGWIYVGAAGENARLYIEDGGSLTTGSLTLSNQVTAVK